MMVHSVEYVFTKINKNWTVGILEDSTQLILTRDQFNRWTKELMAHGLQLVWSDDEMRFQMYGRFFDVPEDVLQDYKVG